MPEFRFRNVPKSLPKNGAQRSLVYLVMKDDRERLSGSTRENTTQLHMTAPVGKPA
jgi:hypothetical protein